jgi:hypothetical protein
VLQIVQIAARSKFGAFQDEEQEEDDDGDEGSQPSLVRRHRY